MGITIKETFQVQAPIDTVWKFVMDPHLVASCMPGAKLEEVVDAQTYVGSIKIKVGAVTTSYKGRVQFTRVDEAEHVIEMTAEGRETGGGIAKGGMVCRLVAVAAGQTEVAAEANVDLTGRIMQVGRGMIEAVSHQLFLQFVAVVQSRLETPATPPTGAEAAAGPSTATPTAPPPMAEPPPIKILPLLLKTLWASIKGWLSRLFR